ncbi:serine/threonine protein kinase [Aquabacterium sp. J223]|uniref:serine/threonine protein kinase n=1 Tax=Aquabacterium sp. J223 TaxID=2898431 RepID=UPI0021AE287D|nr:serine/threonine protein kinase [Aquabacterium sp. J223]UUX97734.1 HDOD domain-containing protein [Aquabacterium sp. J223]
MRPLGQGAQAVVWLALDERLHREVALKRLIQEAAGDDWLHEARAVSGLSHPAIVPLFEADSLDGQPCLVFEYVSGGTLSERLRRQGALPARDAVALMLAVLEGLQAAHDAGVVHRDLKPSNILLDAKGRPRVMDFGIAGRTTDLNDGSIVGTPGYLSPEAARGMAPLPQMDVFSAGVVLGELLTGRRLLSEPDIRRAIQRVQQEDLLLPSLPGPDGVPVDDALRAIVQRAIARDPQQRHASAAELRQALQQWLEPATLPLHDAAPGNAGNGTLEFLLRRMKHRTDFPALSDAVMRIQRVAASDSESVASLSHEILKDVALTHKLLRLVNSAHYRQVGDGVSTVSRAIALVGFAGIRNMALSLVLLEHMQDKAHASRLREEFLRALMAGTLADSLSPTPREAEEAFLAALLQNLGRLLAGYYFPEEAQQIVQRLPREPGKVTAPAADEERAARQVLGLGYEELALGVTRTWGLPEALQQALRRPPTDAPPAGGTLKPADRLRWTALAANELTAALLDNATPEAMAALAQRHGRVLGLPTKQILEALDKGRQRMGELALNLSLQFGTQSPARRLLPDATVVQPRPEADTLAGHALQATLPLPGQGEEAATADLAPAAAAALDPQHVAAVLAAGIQDITNTMVAENFRLNEVLRMILETIYRALQFRRVVFCLRDAKGQALQGRIGLGDGAAEMAKAFCIDLRPTAGRTPGPLRRGVPEERRHADLGRLGARHRPAPAGLVPATAGGAVLPPAAAADQVRTDGPHLRRQGQPGRCGGGREGTVAAAHPAQPGRDGLPAGQLKTKRPAHGRSFAERR